MKRALLALLFVAGCGGNSMPSSGVAELDQTAAFLKDVVTGLRNSKTYEKADQISTYLTSALGKAEYWPPNPKFEEDAAELYHGKMPSEDVAVWDQRYDISSFKYYILVSPDMERNVVILDAYDWQSDEKLFTWEL